MILFPKFHKDLLPYWQSQTQVASMANFHPFKRQKSLQSHMRLSDFLHSRKSQIWSTHTIWKEKNTFISQFNKRNIDTQMVNYFQTSPIPELVKK